MDPSETSRQLESTTYNYGLGYLRAFGVLLVLAHHAVLAYHPFAPQIPKDMAASRWWLAFPVVDESRSGLVELIAGFNDTFLMAMLFFVSGLFVWGSLKRKGEKRFLADRSVRLGIPFVVVALLVAPLSYYPSYLASGNEPGFSGFWSMWRSLGNWPAGPGWFIWLLLVFGAMAAGVWRWKPAWGTALGDEVRRIRRPRTLFLLLAGISWIAYISMAIGFPTWHWSTVGPFSFQSSRLLLYLVYFGFGLSFGAAGLETTILKRQGPIAQSWRWWVAVAVGSYAIVVAINAAGERAGSSPFLSGALGSIAFVVTAAAASMMLLALFTRFVKESNPVWDSLDRNAYGMYLIHYPIASAAMFALLDVSLPALAKALIAVVVTVIVSWLATAVLRRSRTVARVV